MDFDMHTLKILNFKTLSTQKDCIEVSWMIYVVDYQHTYYTFQIEV